MLTINEILEMTSFWEGTQDHELAVVRLLGKEERSFAEMSLMQDLDDDKNVYLVAKIQMDSDTTYLTVPAEKLEKYFGKYAKYSKNFEAIIDNSELLIHEKDCFVTITIAKDIFGGCDLGVARITINGKEFIRAKDLLEQTFEEYKYGIE
jgi:hypothetical protein